MEMRVRLHTAVLRVLLHTAVLRVLLHTAVLRVLLHTAVLRVLLHTAVLRVRLHTAVLRVRLHTAVLRVRLHTAVLRVRLHTAVLRVRLHTAVLRVRLHTAVLRVLLHTAVLLVLLAPTAGDLEPTFGRCCAYGANWAREAQQCSAFPAPVTGIPSEHQSVCLTAAGICCLRYFRDEQCQKGKQAAQVGQECVANTNQGGEYFQDCCQGCKLGLFSGSMGMGCSMGFKFGFPWDNTYLECCSQATPGTSPGFTDISNQVVDGSNLYPGLVSPAVVVSGEGEDLCARFPGKLCAHVCVPTPGSYRCLCRARFTLSTDGKTCIQDSLTDRCRVNNPCAHTCRDTGVAIECSCNPGFKLALDQRSCEDVDECLDGSGNCNRTTHFCINTQGGFTCQKKGGPTDCIAGYKYSIQQQTCVDIDECAENEDSCDWSTQTCVNSVGSFRCIDRQPTCDFGYRYNDDKRACVDVNECEEGRDICNKLSETCVNSLGDYWCAPKLNQATVDILTASTSASFNIPPPPVLPPRPPIFACPPGMVFDILYQVCVDVDECASQPCLETEICENTQGSFKCECQVGFFRDDADQNCKDLNECQLGSHTCSDTQRCDNTLGSYACIRIAGCGTGYTLNHNTGECDDNDECKLKTHDCGQLGARFQCVNIKGSFRCMKKTCPPNRILNDEGLCVNLTCNIGFKPIGGNCQDINECAEGTPCERNEQCINTHGSFNCRPLLNCGAGYKMNNFGSQCIDVDECADGTDQCTGNQVCSNRQGGYICQCPTGFRLNSLRQCQDVNECEAYYGSVCSNNAVCENTEGSYHCNCKAGFKQSNDGRTCLDVDECAEIPGICHHNCINVWGSHQCTCRAGHSLARDNRTCTDINECEEYRGRGRLCIGICVNTVGTFKCTCPDGYTLASDGRTCKDINECETSNVCRGENDHCVNTHGGYKCNSIDCPNNYIRDTRHKNRCKKVSLYCLEDDEACHRKPLSYSYNFLPLVSNLTLPSSGQVDLFTMRGPLWSSTTVQFELELESARAPIGVEAATRQFFYLKRTSFNQAVISLVKSVSGPQEIQLALNMQLYQQGKYSGSAIAKLLVYVSEHDF